MPVTIHGSGSISGLSVGGLGSGVVNTATLANGAAVGTKLGTGAVLQVINSLNTYPHQFAGVPNTEYTVESASSTNWETSITVNQGNKVHAVISLMVGKQGDANTYFDLYYNVDGGSYAKTAQGDASGSRSRHLANVRSYNNTYNIEESTAQVMFTPTISGSTGAVKFQCRVTQRAGGNRIIRVNHCEANDSEGAVVVSSLSLMEIKS